MMALRSFSLLLLLLGKAAAGRIPAAARIHPRADSPVDVCARWSHQTAVVNGTIYIYGGQSKSVAGQTADTWNNNFLTLSVTNDWQTSAPQLRGLAQPNGPPPVANGYLWHDYDNIFLYGGLFSDINPVTNPTPFSLWQYGIDAASWGVATTSVAADSGSSEIQRAAEGAGVSVPGRSLGFYFGGHLDGYTTEGWSQNVPRVYLKSLLEFDLDTKVFRNVTKSGLEKAGVPERADGVLVFVPWGTEGILLAIGGGTNQTFSQMNIVDVYDLATKRWTKQSTDGPMPLYRVNPCAVVGSAPDGSSHNIYFFGGQNLVPYKEQKQYDDMYILTVPAFRWIQVDQSNQAVPPARAGHTCDMIGSQMVVIGGYTDPNLSCDSPGIYVFDASKLQWTTSYSAVAGGYGSSSGDAASTKGTAENPYKVPQQVVDVVGGNTDGGATVTRPIVAADPDSPIATANAADYKYTTYVYGPTSTSTVRAGSASGPDVGAIVGGVVGGIVLIVIIVFAGAFWMYKRKIRELRESAGRINSVGAEGYYKPGEAGYVGTHDQQPMMIPAELPGEGALGMGGPNGNGSSTDLNEMQGEPTFWGVLLSPRRSLRVVNH